MPTLPAAARLVQRTPPIQRPRNLDAQRPRRSSTPVATRTILFQIYMSNARSLRAFRLIYRAVTLEDPLPLLNPSRQKQHVC